MLTSGSTLAANAHLYGPFGEVLRGATAATAPQRQKSAG
jgi:hypothetical protein